MSDNELNDSNGSDLEWKRSWGYKTGMPCMICHRPLTDDNSYFGHGDWICNLTCRPPNKNSELSQCLRPSVMRQFGVLPFFLTMNTTRKYKIHVAVELPMSYEQIAYNLELEPAFHDEMKPIRTCSDDMPICLQMATGELREYQAQPKREDRQNLAKRLASEIAAKLVAAMEHEDTHNGYKKNSREDS